MGGGNKEHKIFFTLSSGLRDSLSTNVGTRAELESVIAGVMAANFVGSDTATLETRVVNIESPTIFNIDGSIFSTGFRTTSEGATAPGNEVGVITVETEDSDRLENSLSFGVRVAMVRDASKGMI